MLTWVLASRRMSTRQMPREHNQQMDVSQLGTHLSHKLFFEVREFLQESMLISCFQGRSLIPESVSLQSLVSTMSSPMVLDQIIHG
jgi:hypothetical protein